VLVSEDNGKTYSKNLKSIPADTDIYVKCEISVKSSGPWWPLLENTVKFEIESSPGIELCDYSYGNYEKKESKGCASFTVIASNKPKKSEIIFKIPKKHAKDLFDIEFTYGKKIHEAYNKKTRLNFIQKKVIQKIWRIFTKNSEINVTGTITLNDTRD
jgi:hypothetical protein